MDNLWLVFLTGLTTGGLSCLAVQGGLLASSIAKQTEDELLRNDSGEGAKHQPAKPILFFLGSKIVAYTVLGALLGALGSVLQLTPYMRAALQIAIGIYMLGLALHLLSVHPFFRYFMPQPPRFITRFMRQKARSGGDDVITPTFLGAMTVFIPCGVTVAMMAVAVGTGNALAGAVVMLAFTLGTTPLFFTLGYTAAKLGAKKQAVFLKVAAVLVLVLGLLSVEGGLNLAGSPISASAIQQGLVRSLDKSDENSEAGVLNGSVLRLTATTASYSPSIIKAKANLPYSLEITSKNNQGCGRALAIPALGIQQVLPENGTTTVEVPPQPAGILRVTCSMGMYSSVIQFE